MQCFRPVFFISSIFIHSKCGPDNHMPLMRYYSRRAFLLSSIPNVLLFGKMRWMAHKINVVIHYHCLWIEVWIDGYSIYLRTNKSIGQPKCTRIVCTSFSKTETFNTEQTEKNTHFNHIFKLYFKLKIYAYVSTPEWVCWMSIRATETERDCTSASLFQRASILFCFISNSIYSNVCALII